MSQRVLVAIDGSDPATAALEYALERFDDETITVLHVIDVDEPDGSLRQHVLSDEYDAEREAAERAAEAIMETAQTYADEHDVAITPVVVYGRPAHRIAAYAEDNDIDTVVMGTHDRSGLSRLLLGSLSEVVARRSSVPVTVVDESSVADRGERAEHERTDTDDVAESPAFRRCPGCATTLYTRLEFCPGCLGETRAVAGTAG